MGGAFRRAPTPAWRRSSISSEAPVHPHNIARRTFLDLDGVFQPAPAPRYSAMELDRPDPPRREGEDGDAILDELGYSPAKSRQMRMNGVLL